MQINEIVKLLIFAVLVGIFIFLYFDKLKDNLTFNIFVVALFLSFIIYDLYTSAPNYFKHSSLFFMVLGCGFHFKNRILPHLGKQ